MEPNKDILLPKLYLSYSQWDMWKKNPERYKREYFEKGKKLDTAALRFGSSTAKMIEDREHEIMLPGLPVYSENEYEVRTVVNGVPVFSKLDSYDPNANVFIDHKTGKIPWTQSKVQKHDQLPWYATVLKWSIGTMPDYCDLVYIETEDSKIEVESFFTVEKKIKYTGKIITFRREFDSREIERIEDDILKVALEISEAYREFIGEL